MRAAPIAAWQAPLQWPAREDRESVERRGTEWLLKAAAMAAFFALTVLDRFGLRWGDVYSAHPAMLVLYGLLAAMLLVGAAELDLRGAVRYAVLAGVVGASYLVNATFDANSYATVTSWLLLLTLYLPFAFALRKDAVSPLLWHWIVQAYVAFAILVAAAGIAQFAAQFFFRPVWLFDFTPLIPPPIRGFEVWKGVHQVGDWFKSNGFFLREPSFLSLHMAFAMLCELTLSRRRWVMAILAIALVLSYSGSGFIVLAVGLLFPLTRRSLLGVAAFSAAAAAVFYLFGDALNLSYTVARMGEFTTDKSSAYCRFIDPALVTLQDIDANPWTSVLGHGPGSLHKAHNTCETTFAKAPFEYGLLGTLALGMLVVAALGRSSVPIRIRAALGAQWVTQAYLLSAEWVLLAYLLCAMWPQRADAPSGVH